jgi:hypothetical protein
MHGLRKTVLILKTVAGVALCLSLMGCHSAYIAATVSNHTAKTLSLIEVDYPSASFGTQMLAPGQDFHYRFKVLGSGPVKVIYTDSQEHEVKATGPDLHEGAEGPLTIVLGEGGVTWLPSSFPAGR